jgi:hypothetical protein
MLRINHFQQFLGPVRGSSCFAMKSFIPASVAVTGLVKRPLAILGILSYIADCY